MMRRLVGSGRRLHGGTGGGVLLPGLRVTLLVDLRGVDGTLNGVVLRPVDLRAAVADREGGLAVLMTDLVMRVTHVATDVRASGLPALRRLTTATAGIGRCSTAGGGGRSSGRLCGSRRRLTSQVDAVLFG